MRMAGPDIVLFVVGALLFSGATAAIVTREGGIGALGEGGSALGIYNVAYSTEESAVGEAASVSFGSGEASFDVTSADVSKVVLVVECSDSVPGPAGYTVTVEVTPPAGSNLTYEPQSVSCGSAEVPFDVADVPPGGTVRGGTPDEARANVGADANATKAMGKWTFKVTGARNGPAAPLPLPAQTVPSGSLALKVETWEPTLTPVQK